MDEEIKKWLKNFGHVYRGGFWGHDTEIFTKEEFAIAFVRERDLAVEHRARKELATEIERVLDALNGEKGDLCLYCDAKEYDGKVGIIHQTECIILKLRGEMR